MDLHAELNQRALLNSKALPWLPSPMAGVERDAPDSRLERHSPLSGEEIRVLEGVFQDHHGTYPAGSWLRNPPGSAHTPWSEAGSTIWVTPTCRAPWTTTTAETHPTCEPSQPVRPARPVRAAG